MSDYIDTGYCLIKISSIESLKLDEDRIVITYADFSIWTKPLQDLSRPTLLELSKLPLWPSKDDLRIVKQLAI